MPPVPYTSPRDRDGGIRPNLRPEEIFWKYEHRSFAWRTFRCPPTGSTLCWSRPKPHRRPRPLIQNNFASKYLVTNPAPHWRRPPLFGALSQNPCYLQTEVANAKERQRSGAATTVPPLAGGIFIISAKVSSLFSRRVHFMISACGHQWI